MKKGWSRKPIVLACALAALILLAALFRGNASQQIVYDYAKKDLEQLTAQGQAGPRFFAVCAIAGDTVQTGKEKTAYSGSITCALYGFPEDSGRVESVTFQTYIDGTMQTTQAVSLWPWFLGGIQVVKAPFRAALPDGSTLECILEAETTDGVRYRHTAMTMAHDVDSLRFNCRTERCGSAGGPWEILWSAGEA